LTERPTLIITSPILLMKDLHSILENPFDPSESGMNKSLAFTTDHLQKMISNNPGGFLTARIAATSAALAAVQSFATTDETKLAIRKARKASKDMFRKSLPASITKLHAAVVAKFGAKSPDDKECFPGGRNLFRKSTDDALQNHLQAMINGLTARQAALGAQVVTDANALLTGWNGVWSASETSSGAKTLTEADRRNARAALCLELFKNLLTIALNFPDQPAKLDLFMQQSLLENHPAAKVATATVAVATA
jgi:hypothetical protein